jgi:hypothetical protein
MKTHPRTPVIRECYEAPRGRGLTGQWGPLQLLGGGLEATRRVRRRRKLGRGRLGWEAALLARLDGAEVLGEGHWLVHQFTTNQPTAVSAGGA